MAINRVEIAKRTMETQQGKIINFVYKVPINLAIIFASAQGALQFIDIRNDTSSLINAVFVVMMGLSAMCFSFAGAQKDIYNDIYTADRLIFAGEKLLHGAILVIVSSLGKYILFEVNVWFDIDSTNILFQVIFWSVVTLFGIVFANGLLFAHKGISILNDLLLLRMVRHPGWDE